MNVLSKGLRQSALVMKIMGWGLGVGPPVGKLLYPPDADEQFTEMRGH